MSYADDVLALVNGELDEGEATAVLQALIDSGDAWMLEGSIGRACMDAIEARRCMLGEEGHRDYWGNYIPSRTEVRPGTMGSPEYVAARRRDGCIRH